MTSLSSTNAAPRTLRKPNIRLAVTHSNTRQSPMHIIAARGTLTLFKRMHICLRIHFTYHSRILLKLPRLPLLSACVHGEANCCLYRRQVKYMQSRSRRAGRRSTRALGNLRLSCPQHVANTYRGSCRNTKWPRHIRKFTQGQQHIVGVHLHCTCTASRPVWRM